jgi:hypothetical protein
MMYYATDAISETSKTWSDETMSERERLRRRLIELVRDVLVAARDVRPIGGVCNWS